MEAAQFRQRNHLQPSGAGPLGVVLTLEQIQNRQICKQFVNKKKSAKKCGQEERFPRSAWAPSIPSNAGPDCMCGSMCPAGFSTVCGPFIWSACYCCRGWAWGGGRCSLLLYLLTWRPCFLSGCLRSAPLPMFVLTLWHEAGSEGLSLSINETGLHTRS